jgi:hypothetical protein
MGNGADRREDEFRAFRSWLRAAETGRRLLLFIAVISSSAPAACTQSLGTTLSALIGLRAGFRDAPALVSGLDIHVSPSAALGASLRQAVLIADSLESRTTLTIDLPIGTCIRTYAGIGVAYNESGSGYLDPMVTAGVDLTLLGPLGISMTVNHLSRETGSDTEMIVSVGWWFGRESPDRQR